MAKPSLNAAALAAVVCLLLSQLVVGFRAPPSFTVARFVVRSGRVAPQVRPLCASSDGTEASAAGAGEAAGEEGGERRLPRRREQRWRRRGQRWRRWRKIPQ